MNESLLEPPFVTLNRRTDEDFFNKKMERVALNNLCNANNKWGVGERFNNTSDSINDDRLFSNGIWVRLMSNRKN